MHAAADRGGSFGRVDAPRNWMHTRPPGIAFPRRPAESSPVGGPDAPAQGTRRRVALGLAAAWLAFDASTIGQSAKASSAADQKLPPLSYVCTMAGDEDVIEDKPGTCRKCGMKLVPIRLDAVWTCLLYTSDAADE